MLERANQGDFMNNTLNKVFMACKKLRNIFLKKVKMRMVKRPTINKEANILIFFLELKKIGIKIQIPLLAKYETFIFREHI